MRCKQTPNPLLSTPWMKLPLRVEVRRHSAVCVLRHTGCPAREPFPAPRLELGTLRPGNDFIERSLAAPRSESLSFRVDNEAQGSWLIDVWTDLSQSAVSVGGQVAVAAMRSTGCVWWQSDVTTGRLRVTSWKQRQWHHKQADIQPSKHPAVAHLVVKVQYHQYATQMRQYAVQDLLRIHAHCLQQTHSTHIYNQGRFHKKWRGNSQVRIRLVKC